MYHVSRSRKQVAVIRFDNHINPSFTRLFDIQEEKPQVLNNLFPWRNKLYARFSEVDKKKRHQRWYVQEVDPNSDAGFIGEKKEILRFEPTDAELQQYTYEGPLIHYMNTEGNMLIYWNALAKDTKDQSEQEIRLYSFRLLDSSFSLIWSVDNIEMPKSYMENSYNRHWNKNRLVWISKPSPAGRNQKQDVLSIISLSSDGSLKHIPIDTSGQSVSNLAFSNIDDDKVEISGFYAARNRNGLKGYFAGSIDINDGSISNIQRFDFSAKMIAEYENASARRFIQKQETSNKNEPGIFNLTSKGIIRKPGGGFYLLSEQQYTFTNILNDGRGNMQLSITFVSNDIYVSSINAANEEEWVVKVPKSQQLDPWFSSFSSFLYNGTLYLFYIDDKKNLDLTPSEAPNVVKSLQGTSLFMATIDASGQLKRQAIYDKKEDKRTFIPMFMMEVEPGLILTRSQGSSFTTNDDYYQCFISVK